MNMSSLCSKNMIGYHRMNESFLYTASSKFKLTQVWKFAKYSHQTFLFWCKQEMMQEVSFSLDHGLSFILIQTQINLLKIVQVGLGLSPPFRNNKILKFENVHATRPPSTVIDFLSPPSAPEQMKMNEQRQIHYILVMYLSFYASYSKVWR